MTERETASVQGEATREAIMEAVAAEFGACSNVTADRILAATQGSEAYRLWVDDASTVLVRIWSDGTAEVATREDPGAIWSPPTMLREEQV